MMRCAHAMRFGASLQDGGALFRLWAPAARRVELLLECSSGPLALPADPLAGGWHAVQHAGVAAGQRYRWRIDGALVVPDPASRRNPDGPQGASQVIDPLAFAWDDGWAGRPWHEAVFYQLHVGTFTAEGSFDAAARRLPALAALGITAVQLMPLADFPGGFGWGYDGVLPFAPYHGYGCPDALKHFVQAAHRLGLMVFGDVVYNHFGPEGNHLHAYAPGFFSQRHHTAWGAGLNFDGEDAATVREFFIANALYWLQEYRFDGLRLDAAHAMLDDGPEHMLHALSAAVRSACAGRHVHLVLENDSNDETRLCAQGSPGAPGRYDGQWNGDVHHTLHVLLTGEHDGYYAEYGAPVAQLGRCLTQGFARQGGPHNAEGAAPRRDADRSAPLGAMVNFLQNHDQIGNRAFGERLCTLADPAALRLAAAIVLLAPSPPLLFMGEENGTATPFPFQYFADWQGALADAVRSGRRQEFAHFPRYAEAAAAGRLPDPCSRATFDRCKLDDSAQRGLDVQAVQAAQAAQAWRSFYTELLHLRATALWPLLPTLAASGHTARDNGTLLEVVWHFGADAPARRRLQMQANLGPAAVHAPPSPGARPLFALGDADAGRLGPWSARWAWLAE